MTLENRILLLGILALAGLLILQLTDKGYLR